MVHAEKKESKPFKSVNLKKRNHYKEYTLIPADIKKSSKESI
jgi:hypothetical protein